MAPVAPAEGDLSALDRDEAAVGDRDPMGIAAEIGLHLVRAAEGWLGVDHPLLVTQRAEAVGEGGRPRQRGKLAEEAEPAAGVGGLQFAEKQAPELAYLGRYTHRVAIANRRLVT